MNSALMNECLSRMPDKDKRVLLDWFRKDQRARDWPTQHSIAAVHHQINERAQWEARFRRSQENGRVALIRSGMDCDCTQYYRVSHIDVPTSLVAWVRNEDHHQEWLDGPESTSIGKPSENPERYASADRALEAYEDGHPHRVSWGPL